MNRKTGRGALGLLLALVLLSGTLFSFSSAAAEEGTVGLLDMGFIVNRKMKALAAKTIAEAAKAAAGAESGTEADGESDGISYRTESGDIKAIRMAEGIPGGFEYSEENTVSAAESEYPVYIYFDNHNDAGIIYFYTEADRIAMNPDSSVLFAWNTELTDISGVASWDSSRVVDMSGMFMNAKSLPDALALKNWDTSNVTDMSYMFSYDASLMFLDVSNWDTGRVVNMSNMFQVGESWKANGQLTEIVGLGNLDVSNVTNMTCMFYGAGQMTYYDISRWNVSKVTSMNHMFCDNRNLRSLDLSQWDVSSLRTVYCMFDDNVKLKTIGDVSHWHTANLVDVGGWLNECSAFTGDNTGLFDLSGWDTSNLKSAGEMLLRTKIKTLDLSGWTFYSVTNGLWEGAGTGIFYEFGNWSPELCGLGQMLCATSELRTVYISQAGLDSYNLAVEIGVNVLDMWKGSKAGGFTVK